MRSFVSIISLPAGKIECPPILPMTKLRASSADDVTEPILLEVDQICNLACPAVADPLPVTTRSRPGQIAQRDRARSICSA